MTKMKRRTVWCGIRIPTPFPYSQMALQWTLRGYFVQDRSDNRGVVSEIIYNIHIETFSYLQSINMEINKEAGGESKTQKSSIFSISHLSPFYCCLIV